MSPNCPLPTTPSVEWADSPTPYRPTLLQKIAGFLIGLLAGGCELVKNLLVLLGFLAALAATIALIIHYWPFIFLVAVIVWVLYPYSKPR